MFSCFLNCFVNVHSLTYFHLRRFFVLADMKPTFNTISITFKDARYD
nr:MAG TPA: hypothetical protein [Caudoviricetes sp.]